MTPMQRAWLFAGFVAIAMSITACSSLPVDMAACLINVCN